MPKKNTDKNLMRGQFATVIDLDTLRAASKDGSLPDEIPVLPKGEYMTLPYGNLVLDDTIFEQMIGNFKANIRRAVPVDIDHAWENTAAAGWVKELVNKADGLWAKVKWNKKGMELVAEEIYKMISAEWSFDYVDPQKSTHHGAVLVAATLTNRPLMQSMPTITASEKNLTNDNGVVILLNEDSKLNDNTMPTIEEILTKPVAERSQEDLDFLEEHKAELTEDQAKQLEDEAKAADADKGEGDDTPPADNPEDEGDDADKGDGDEDKGEGEDNPDADKTETVAASELTRLRKIEADHKAAEVMKAAEDFISPFMASSTGGKVLPAAKDSFIKLAQSLNAEQKELLKVVLAKTADQKIAKVEGKDEEAGLTATEQYNNLVNEKIKAGKSPAQANKEVRKENKEIYNAFIAENK